jgi:tRNA1(Val) A37 N6-methylase TrmN6
MDAEIESDGPAFTEDGLFDGRVRLRQPANGARAAIDPVFLAAAVPAQRHQLILDIGCGTGAATLCLLHRVPECRVIGLDMQRDLVRLATENIALNGFGGRATALIGDLLQPPPRLSPGSFDHVMANPPFLPAGHSTPPVNPARAAASVEGEAGLGDWVRFALAMLRGKGSVTMVHRADRLDALLGHLAGRVGEVVVYPLWPYAGRAASRVLVRARKEVAAPARLLPGLTLHEADGQYTAAAEAVLRGGEALAL